MEQFAADRQCTNVLKLQAAGEWLLLGWRHHARLNLGTVHQAVSHLCGELEHWISHGNAAGGLLGLGSCGPLLSVGSRPNRAHRSAWVACAS